MSPRDVDQFSLAFVEPSAVAAPEAPALPDAEARDRIVEALDRNLLVEAGAGSGKTTSLVGRMVALVATGRARIEEIAAVTFTKKAAAELRERFQLEVERALRRAAGEEPEEGVEDLQLERLLDDPEALPRLDRALRHIDRAFLGTIHAFCARLLRERPVEAGLDPGFQELTGPEEEEMRREFWLRHLDARRQAADPRLAVLEAVGIRPEDLGKTFKTVSENPDVTFPFEEVDPPDYAEVRRDLERLHDEVLALMPAVEPENGWDKLQVRIRKLETSRRVYGWDDPIRFFEALGGLVEGKKDAIGKRWVTPTRDYRKEALPLAKEMQAKFEAFCLEGGPAWQALDQWYAHRYPAAMRFLLNAARAYEAERVRAGRLTFQDLLVRAARLLRESPAARADLARRFPFLLVDEFQDTDPVQAEVLLLLAADDADETDWRKVTPRLGALFVVGDPKQSIYRFRRADIAVYSEVRDLFRKWRSAGLGEVVTLTANFRSRPPIEAFVDGEFADRFPAAATREQAAFAPLEVQQGDGPQQGVFWYEIACEKDSLRAVAEADAEALASWIAGRVEAGERAPGDFLILPYRRKFLALYAQALEARGVPVQVTGGELLIEEEVSELRLLLEALADPDDPVLTVAVLVGSFFGLDYESLAAWRLEAGGRFEFHKAEPEASTPVGEALARMRAWWLLSRRAPADVTVATIVDELGLLPHAAAGELGAARAGALGYLVDTIRALGIEGDTSLGAAVRALDMALDTGEAEAPLEPGREDVVRIMNLHKAKGTEAPVVVLAHPTGDLDWPPMHWIDREGGRAIGWLQVGEAKGPNYKIVQARPPGWAEMSAREREFAEAEDDRLLYVAATRAMDELVVARYGKKEKESTWRKLYPRLTARCEKLELEPQPPPAVPEAAATLDAIEARVAEVAARREAAARPSYRAVTVTERAKGEGFTGEELAGLQGRGRDWGSAVHRAFEAAGRGAEGPALRRACRAALVEHDRPVGADGEPKELGELVGLVEAVWASPLLARARAAEQVLYEVPFALPEPVAAGDDGGPPLQEIVEGVIDLAFREPDGWVIVDYKTDPIADDEASDRRKRIYRRQVDEYAKCWEALSGEAVKERVLLFATVGEEVAW